MNKGQIGELLAFFKGKPVTNDVLKAYCTRNKMDVIGTYQYEEFQKQQEHDDRVVASLPLIFAELSKFQHAPEFISDKKRKEIADANEDIEWKVAKIVEDTELPYGKEIDVVFGNLSRALHGIVTNAGTRMNNMCAQALSAIAKEKFGESISVRQLAVYYRETVLKQSAEGDEAQPEAEVPAEVAPEAPLTEEPKGDTVAGNDEPKE